MQRWIALSPKQFVLRRLSIVASWQLAGQILVLALTSAAILASLSACAQITKLPADWPIAGLTLPAGAELRQSRLDLQYWQRNGYFYHYECATSECWAVCFDCPGGETTATEHFKRVLKPKGLGKVPELQMPTELIYGKTTVENDKLHYYLSKDKTKAICLHCAAEASYQAGYEGEMTMYVTKAIDVYEQREKEFPKGGF